MMLCKHCKQNEIPPGRSLYCSNRCGRAACKLRERLALRIHADTSQRARRSCLRCGTEFMGDGPWNRICPYCKRTQPDVQIIGVHGRACADCGGPMRGVSIVSRYCIACRRRRLTEKILRSGKRIAAEPSTNTTE